eukprot:6479951-Amphidinium_carterae.3
MGWQRRHAATLPGVRAFDWLQGRRLERYLRNRDLVPRRLAKLVQGTFLQSLKLLDSNKTMNVVVAPRSIEENDGRNGMGGRFSQSELPRALHQLAAA